MSHPASPPPAALGFTMPPEWAVQEAVWLSWPGEDPRHWGGTKHHRIHDKFAEIAAAISRFETVRINAAAEKHEDILGRCSRFGARAGFVELFDHPHDDVWCRDHGPIFVKNQTTGEVAVTDWGFNAWGGKFPPWDQDDAIPSRTADALALRRFEAGMILEGGAVEINGRGQLLTTEAVLLNPNRNPSLSRGQIEERLRDFLGAKEILWLRRGIEGDDTDGHIDDLVRFASDRTILACVERDRNSANHAVLEENLLRLKSFRDADGLLFEIVELPMPAPCNLPGWRLPILPASYANFLVLNDALLAPTFRQRRADQHALGILSEVFPTREIIPIDCLDLVAEGGSLHCISQQQPL